jgi:hypothetical protein
MTIALAMIVKNSRSQALAYHLAGAIMQFYTGPQPDAGAAITTEILLAELELPTPAGAVVDGAFIFDTSPTTLGIAEGGVVWVRIVTPASAWLADLSAGVDGSGAAVQLPSTAIYEGSAVSILSGTLAEP